MSPKIGDIGPQPEIGAYAVRVRAIDKEESKQTPGEYYYRWTFVTAEGLEFKPTSSLNLGKKSKSYRWCKAILGVQADGLDFPDDVLGKPALLAVEHDEDGYAFVAEVHPRSLTPVNAPVAPLPDVEGVTDDPITF